MKIALVFFALFAVAIVWSGCSIIEKANAQAEKTNEIRIEKAKVLAEKEAVKEKKKAEADKKKEMAAQSRKDLEESIIQLSSEYPGNIGFVLLNKSNDELIEVNADYVFTSASLYKLYVTYAVLNEVDQGRLSLDTVMNGQTNETVNHYLHDVITWSANKPAIALANRLGWNTIENFIQENGFTETTFNSDISQGVNYRGTLQTSPGDVTQFLNRLMEGELLSAESTEYFMSLLENQELVYALNTGLSENIQFAHKTGILDYVSHDAGIITDSNGDEYIVVVMSDGWTSAYGEATPMFEKTGKAIMDYLGKQRY